MKMLRKIFFGAIALLSAGIFASCSEEATLEGAKDIFIEIYPNDIALSFRDTIAISAKVTNESGKKIDTKIAWSVDDENIAQVVGDTAITCVEGAQGTTRLRATLLNGKSAITEVRVGKRAVRGLTPETPFRHTYNSITNDTVWFICDPAAALEEADFGFSFEMTEEYVPAAAGEQANFVFAPDPVFVEMVDINKPEESEDEAAEEDAEPVEDNHVVAMRPTGRVGVVFTAPRLSGRAVARLTVKDGQSEFEAEQELLIYPVLNITFFENRSALPDPQGGANKPFVNLEMDLNSELTVSVAVGVGGMWDADIINAYDFYNWKVEGACVLPIKQTVEYRAQYGYVADLVIKSGTLTGTAQVRFQLPDKEVVADIVVTDYSKTYPVDVLEVPAEISLNSGQTYPFECNIYPATSFSHNIPVCVSEDESIVTVRERTSEDGNHIYVQGHNPGTTYLHVTAGGKSATIKVVVSDVVMSVNWLPNLPQTVLKDEEVTVGVNVMMASGQAYTGNVQWVVSDPTVASITPDPADPSYAVIRGLKGGEIKINAIVGDFDAGQRDFKVIALENITIDGTSADYAYGDIEPGDTDEQFLLYYEFGGKVAYVLFSGYDGSNIAGHYTGPVQPEDVVTYDNQDFGVASFDITITDNGDGTYTVNGTLNLTNGLVVTLINTVVEDAF